MADGFSEPVDTAVLGSGGEGAEEGPDRKQNAPEVAEIFDAFFRRHASNVQVFLLRRGLRPEEVDDLVQETFLRAFRSFDQLRSFGVSEVESAWIRTIALNVFRNRGRTAEKAVSLEGLGTEDGEGFDPPDPRTVAADQQVISKENRVRILEVLVALAPGQREVLELWLAGRSYEEIGQLSGKSLQNIRATLHKAKVRLSEHFRQVDSRHGGRP